MQLCPGSGCMANTMNVTVPWRRWPTLLTIWTCSRSPYPFLASYQIRPHASEFFHDVPWWLPWSSIGTLSWPGVGTTTLSPHTMHPSWAVSFRCLVQYCLSSLCALLIARDLINHVHIAIWTAEMGTSSNLSPLALLSRSLDWCIRQWQSASS